jgi:hypothetical protein
LTNIRSNVFPGVVDVDKLLQRPKGQSRGLPCGLSLTHLTM